MLRMRIGTSLLAATLLLQACDAGSDGSSAVLVTDSAGVRIVQHALSAPESGWSVDTADPLVLEADPDTPIFEVRSALKLADGRYAVADGGNSRIVFFDESGRLLSATGRAGEGPGEFLSISFLARGRADSLVAWDRRLRRVSVLGPSGDFAHSFSLQTTDEVPYASLNGVYGDGSFLATGFVDLGGGSPESGRQVYTSPSYHFGPDGSLLSTVGDFPTGESYYEVLEDGFSVYPLLFGMESFRLVAGSRLVAATSDRYDFRLLTPDGAPETVLRREPRRRPVTAELRNTVVAGLLEGARPGEEERLRPVLNQMDVPEHLPEFDDAFADALGRLWVREYAIPEPPVGAWVVYGPEGFVVASVELPTSFAPMDAGEDFVLGVLTDDFDIETVVEYALMR